LRDGGETDTLKWMDPADGPFVMVSSILIPTGESSHHVVSDIPSVANAPTFPLGVFSWSGSTGSGAIDGIILT
jgi:hypothetical protein